VVPSNIYPAYIFQITNGEVESVAERTGVSGEVGLFTSSCIPPLVTKPSGAKHRQPKPLTMRARTGVFLHMSHDMKVGTHPLMIVRSSKEEEEGMTGC